MEDRRNPLKNPKLIELRAPFKRPNMALGVGLGIGIIGTYFFAREVVKSKIEDFRQIGLERQKRNMELREAEKSPK